MSEPFLAEIRIVGFNFAPRGWALCDGQILPINQNQSLYALLGTTYGGDGRTSFALPDLRGRTPIHAGQGSGLSNRPLGSKSGEEAHILAAGEMPQHDHAAQASTDPVSAPVAAERVLADAAIYHDATNKVALAPESISNEGNGQGHPNMQPYLALNFCIALQGLFPSRN